MRVCFLLSFISFSLFIVTNALANDTDTMARVAYSPEWLALGFYQKTLLGGYRSDVDNDDDSFFFAGPKGYYSPKDELIASLNEFNHTNDKQARAARCLYPARVKFIGTALPKSLRALSTDCYELVQWKGEFNADSVSLIFPSAYLDSPSSMFGHTLLRFNKQNTNPILSLSVNYAATKDPNDSEFTFIYKGLVGGYPGDVTILPYYMKLKEYKDMESRDIWEYQLNLSKAETDLLLDVIWEIKNTKFDYYFFTKNCSYRILSFLHSVRPQADLLDQFSLATIPVDTVRSVVEKNFVTQIDYRPSVKTKFNHSIQQLDKDEQEKIIVWVNGSGFESKDLPSDPAQAATMLDVAFDYSRITRQKKSHKSKTSYDLLKQRKQIKEKSSLLDVAQPQLSDDAGHRSNNIKLAFGYRYDQQYIKLNMRPAYHDLLDPPLGYPVGSLLKFGDIDLTYYANDGFKLEHFDFVSITSLKGRNAFFSPTSWKVKVGLERYDFRQKRVLAASLEGLLGPAFQITPALLGFTLLGGDIRVAPGFEKGLNVYALAEMGLLGKVASGQYMLSLNADVSVFNTRDIGYTASVEYVFNVDSNHALSFKAQRQYISGDYNSNVNLALSVFF